MELLNGFGKLKNCKWVAIWMDGRQDGRMLMLTERSIMMLFSAFGNWAAQILLEFYLFTGIHTPDLDFELS